MTTDGEPEKPAAHAGWQVAFGVGWLVVIGVTIYLTRDLSPRSWVAGFDWPDLPLVGHLNPLLGPWKFVVLAVVIALVTLTRRRRRSPEGATDDNETRDRDSPE